VRPRRRTLAGLLAALAVSGGLVGAELSRGALHLGEAPPPRPCTEHTTLDGGSFDAKLQRIALDGLSRAACRLGTTRAKLALALDSPADRKRIAKGNDLNAVLRKSLIQAVDEQRKAGSLNGVEAFLAKQLIGRTPLSLVQRLLGGG